MTEKNDNASSAGLAIGWLAQTVWRFGKWAIMAAAVWYLWREGALSLDRLRLSADAWRGLPLALLFLGLAAAGMGFRFHCLLRSLGCPSRAAGQLNIAFSGMLAQQIGSDAAFDAMRLIGAKSLGGRGSDIVAALMVDRLIGLAALSGWTMAGLALFWTGSGWLLPGVAVVAGLVLVPAAFALCHSLLEKGALPWLWRLPGTRFAAAIGGAVKRFRRHGGRLAGLFALSLAGHACTFAALSRCGISLTGAAIRPAEAVVGGALASFTHLLPLPMAGLGVGEAAFGQAVAGLRGAADGGDFAPIFLLNRFLLLLMGMAAWLWLSLARSGAGTVAESVPLSEEQARGVLDEESRVCGSE